jgi:hypothetical protein
MSATGLLATSVPQFLDYQLCAASRLPRTAFILINAVWLSPVIAIVGVTLSHQSGLVENGGVSRISARRRTLLKEETS